MHEHTRARPASSDANVEFLVRVSLFAASTTSDLQELAGTLRWARYAKGEVICAKGEPGDSLFLIESGTVKLALSSLETGKEFLLELLHPWS